MENIMFVLLHPIKALRHYIALCGFEKAFGKFGPAPF